MLIHSLLNFTWCKLLWFLIKTTESFNNPVGAVLRSALSQNYELWRFLLEPLVAFLQKFAPTKISILWLVHDNIFRLWFAKLQCLYAEQIWTTMMLTAQQFSVSLCIHNYLWYFALYDCDYSYILYTHNVTALSWKGLSWGVQRSYHYNGQLQSVWYRARPPA